MPANDVLYATEDSDNFMCGMTENYVNIYLAVNGYKIYYWQSERGAEVDFIIKRYG